MAGAANNQKGQPLNKAVAKSNDTADSKIDIKLDALTVNVFFDGTGNNMYNTKAKLNEEHTELKDETSYENYYSNIALLHMACSETSTIKKVYIEGSGTFKHASDTLYGLGLSMGDSGVYDRVTEAFQKVELLNTQLSPSEIILNVFGFSRGSFYARYFCAMAKLKDLKSKAASESGRKQLDLPSRSIRINLVGIYDTVSSHGVNHYNDVKPFQLDIGPKQEIKKIIHLTAQNDYRNHFPLTHINTAAAGGCGFECSLPGAHSDLGGAYTEEWDESAGKDPQYLSIFDKEEKLLNKKQGEIHWSWFENMGYYKTDKPLTRTEGENGDFKVVKARHFKLLGSYYQVHSIRKMTSNSYQFIPLEIMKDITEKTSQLTFTGGSGTAILTQDIGSVSNYPLLKKFRDYAYQYALNSYDLNGLGFMVRTSNVLSKTEEQELYNKFIHNSLDPASLANGSDSRNEGPKRIKIQDNA